MVQLLCSLYGLTIIIITFVFSVSAALTAIDTRSSIYLQVAHLCHSDTVITFVISTLLG